jgi:hypothetical protein
MLIITERLECLAMFIAHVLPDGAAARPFIYPASCKHFNLGDRGSFTEGQLLCIQHLIDKQCPIHPATLIWGARGGDLHAVRTLRNRQVGLWEYACREEDMDARTFSRSDIDATFFKCYVLRHKILVVPQMPNEHVLRAMHYGWAKGAPMTPAMDALFRAKRAATRTTLLCFHVATGLSTKEETPPQLRASFAAMGRVPVDLIERFLLESDLENAETLHGIIPATNSWRITWEDPYLSVWTRNDEQDTFLRKWMRKWMARVLRTLKPRR